MFKKSDFIIPIIIYRTFVAYAVWIFMRLISRWAINKQAFAKLNKPIRLNKPMQCEYLWNSFHGKQSINNCIRMQFWALWQICGHVFDIIDVHSIIYIHNLSFNEVRHDIFN